MPRNDNVTIEDAQIAFRNFSGKEDKFNKPGDRNFVILLGPELAEQMLVAGWNVKYMKARDEEPPQAILHAAVSYKNRPPKILMVTSKNMTYLTEDEVETLDWADIEQADVTLNPYDWEVNGNAGRKAYVSTLVVKIVEDYLVDKWTLWVEDQKRLAIASANKDYVDAEVVATPLEIGR